MPTSILELLQRAVEKLNDVETRLDVRAFVVDEATRANLPGARVDAPEQLFVREHAGELELALYVDPRLVAGLERGLGSGRLDPGSLAPFWVAVEGVSHFVFVAWRALVGRPVSALELELQAEVDKFVIAWLWLAAQGAELSRTGRLLDRLLFDAHALHEGLGALEQERYRAASRAARGFCRRLVERHGPTRATARVTREVRTYYRHGLAEKLRAA